MTETTPWSAAAEPARRIGHAVEFHAEIGSTNDRARAALDEPRGEGRVIVADVQTAGRGRRGRVWLSPAGENLMVSVGLRPRLSAEDAWWLSAAAGLAVVQACRPWARLRLRWPNDALASDGRKVAGLLVETALAERRLLSAIVGIGINANWRRVAMPPEIAADATSLADVSGVQVDRVALLGRVLAALDREVAGVEAGDRPLQRYRATSALDGRRVSVAVGDRRVEGVARGIGDDGSLLVEQPSGTTVAIAHGEVVRVRELSEVPA